MGEDSADFRFATPTQVRKIFAYWKQQNPSPTTELIYQNPYQLLVAVVLSAQTTDKAVNNATQKFFDHIDTPEKMLQWGEAPLQEAIRTIGLFRSKAKNVIALSQQLIERHNSEIPHQLSSLMQLPGVGLKTASVIMNTLFGAPIIAVDTHVFRISRRIGLVFAKNVEATAEALPKVIPKNALQHAHHWLILHGRYVCTARNPQCTSCGIKSFCQKNLNT